MCFSSPSRILSFSLQTPLSEQTWIGAMNCQSWAPIRMGVNTSTGATHRRPVRRPVPLLAPRRRSFSQELGILRKVAPEEFEGCRGGTRCPRREGRRTSLIPWKPCRSRMAMVTRASRRNPRMSRRRSAVSSSSTSSARLQGP